MALRGDFGQLTYAEVDRLANRYGNALRTLGVRQEDRVLLALPDGPDYVGALFGILKLGGVVVMVNPGLDLDGMTSMVRRTRAPAVVTTAGLVDTFEEATESAGREVRLLLADERTEDHPDLAALAVSDELETVRTHRDDPAIWLFSGGTTGEPKAVVQTHRSYANTTELYARRTVGYEPDDVTISVPKLYFGYATGCNLLFPFSVGACAVLFPEHPTPEVLFRLIAEHRPTILVNVPSMITQLLDADDAAERDLSCLRFATSAGEALPPAMYERWRQVFGVELLDGLGTAEMWHIFVTNRPDDVRPGTLGRPVEGFDVRVRDDEGNDLPPGEVGRLWVRGGSRGLGYWQDLDRTVEAFRGEWFVGGDLVSMDEDGYVTYTGRGDDALKVKGKWFAPAELEGVLLEHPAVESCAVVGVRDEDGLTKPVAVVVAEGEQDADAFAEELTQWALDRLEAYKHPRRVVVVEDLPRTHLGKVDRSAIRDLAAG